jgi:hypothetical protein
LFEKGITGGCGNLWDIYEIICHTMYFVLKDIKDIEKLYKHLEAY